MLVSKYYRGIWRNATSSVTIDVTFDVVPKVSIAALTVPKVCSRDSSKWAVSVRVNVEHVRLARGSPCLGGAGGSGLVH